MSQDLVRIEFRRRRLTELHKSLVILLCLGQFWPFLKLCCDVDAVLTLVLNEHTFLRALNHNQQIQRCGGRVRTSSYKIGHFECTLSLTCVCTSVGLPHTVPLARVVPLRAAKFFILKSHGILLFCQCQIMILSYLLVFASNSSKNITKISYHIICLSMNEVFIIDCLISVIIVLY